jgi:hypothetical protein
MKKSLFLYLIFGVLFICTSSTATKKKVGDSRVIFFSGNKWNSECYVGYNSGNQCVWFALGESGAEFSNLHNLTSEYQAYACNCRWEGGGGHGEGGGREEVCDWCWKTMYWDNQIQSIYISDPSLVVVIYDAPNFQGNGYRIWGQGGIDLTKHGWGDRAKSAKIFFR